MATSNVRMKCETCQQERTTYLCPGCLKYFCIGDLNKHHEELEVKFHEIEHQRNQFVQTLDNQKDNSPHRYLFEQINQWEQTSIDKIQQTAQQQRNILQQLLQKVTQQIQINLINLTQQMKLLEKNKDFNEIILNHLQDQLQNLQLQFYQPIQIQQDSSSTFINKLSIPTTYFHHLELKWKPNAQTIAGGNGRGDQLNQLSSPRGIYVDRQQQNIYIADTENHRILKWKLGENNGQIVAGENGKGNRIDQLNCPTDVIVDESNKSLIICDWKNGRVVRWSLENPNGDKEILIENILCSRLTMNENGDLFISDDESHTVKRWRRGEKGGKGTIVAGGNGRGKKLNQLNGPTYIFIDRDETIYVSDWGNHRVMKWLKGANEGIVVAGGQGRGNNLNKVSYPMGLLVNEIGDVYVADEGNDRIMCWSLGSKEGHIVVGGNGYGEGPNQFHGPNSLAFDAENNLYVVDQWNHRIQRFCVDNRY